MHKRRSIRLKNYDYSQSGLYFVTICTQGGVHRFGEIRDGIMILNDVGNIATKCWSTIPHHFPNVVLHEYVIMPNHIHGIIEIIQAYGPPIVGARHAVPESDENKSEKFGPPIVGARHAVPESDENKSEKFGQPIKGSIPTIIRSYKSAVTKSVNEQLLRLKNERLQVGSVQSDWARRAVPLQGKLWQRNYYEHIIRNEQRCELIRNYITNNPKSWEQDRFNQRNSLQEERAIYGDGWDWVL